jgi:3,4-dihydroxy 2-butanone 4-phosphate synthase/GTP cyclohydrolase II
MQAFLSQFQSQKLALICDDLSSSGRAVLCAPAANISSALVNRLITLSTGLIFVALSEQRASAFALSLMERTQSAKLLQTAALPLYQSVESREGVTTGISAADRARTLAVLGGQAPHPRQLVTPGHIFPLATRAGGVLVRSALPEAALDLVTIAGFSDAAVYLDLLSKHGELIRGADIENYARANDILLIKTSELVRYRLESEPLIERIAEAKLPTQHAGELRSYIYRSLIHEGEHVALVKGDVQNSSAPVLTRVQAECTFSDVFGGNQHGSKRSLDLALQAIGKRGTGVLVYLRRPALGVLGDQIDQQGEPVSPQPQQMMRDYGIGAQILRDLGVQKIELLTGSQKNLIGIRPFGLEIVSQVPLE